MIRKMQNTDINRVADIWLKTNLKAHDFIPEQYWTSNYELVKEMMLQAEVYVYEDNKMIQGFVGLSNEYIAGIFVSDEIQAKYSELVKLILETDSMEDEERQYWFDILPSMNDEQIDRLFEILDTEKKEIRTTRTELSKRN